jgi:hypothetical protein
MKKRFSALAFGLSLASCEPEGHLTDVQLPKFDQKKVKTEEKVKAEIKYVLEGAEKDTLEKVYLIRLTPDSENLPSEARVGAVEGYLLDEWTVLGDKEIPFNVREK